MGGDGCLSLSGSDIDFSSKESSEDESRFLSDLDDGRTLSHFDVVTDKFDGQQGPSSSWDFSRHWMEVL